MAIKGPESHNGALKHSTCHSRKGGPNDFAMLEVWAYRIGNRSFDILNIPIPWQL